MNGQKKKTLFSQIILNMQELATDILSSQKDLNVVQQLDYLSHDVYENRSHVPPMLPFVDLEYAVKEEIEYNKRILSNGLFSLMLAYKDFKMWKKDLVPWMTPWEYLRSVMEAYAKLKVWNIDIHDQLYLYNDKVTWSGQSLTPQGLEIVFNELVGSFVMAYPSEFSSTILQKYLYDIEQEKKSIPVKEKKPLLKNKKQWESEQRRKEKKLNLEKEQKKQDVKMVLQDMLTYYEFKNMSWSNYVSIYTPIDCVKEDYDNIKIALSVYEEFISDIKQDLIDYLSYKNDSEWFLSSYKNEKWVLNVEWKLRKLLLDAMVSDSSLLEEKTLDVLNYYKFLRMYDTRSNEALISQENQTKNKEIENLLLQIVPLLSQRKDAYQKRLDY